MSINGSTKIFKALSIAFLLNNNMTDFIIGNNSNSDNFIYPVRGIIGSDGSTNYFRG